MLQIIHITISTKDKIMKKSINKELNIKAGPGEEYDYEGYMVRTQLRRMASQAQELLMLTKDEEQFPAWMQSKMTLASEYMDGFYDFYKYSDYSIMTDSDANEVEDDEESDDMEDMMESASDDMEDDVAQVTIEDYDMMPPSARMMKEQQDADKKG